MHALLLAALFFALGAGPAYAVSCTTGKTSQAITSGDRTITFPGDVAAGKYANLGSGSWVDLLPDAIDLEGTDEACVTSPQATLVIDGPFGAAQDADTYYECTAEHGYTSGSCINNVTPTSESGYHTSAAFAPDSDGLQTIERIHVRDYGDGVSFPNATSGDLIVRRSWLENLHDDAIEDDWCADRDVTVDDSFLDGVFMAFAFDLRGDALPCVTPRGNWTITNNKIRLHRFTHSYKEKPGHGGLFKDDGTGENPTVGPMSGNVILMGPDAGDGQVLFPLTDTLGPVCDSNVYLWDGTNTAWTAAMATGGAEDNDSNGERLADLQLLWGADCATVVLREDVCGACASAEFLATVLPELGGWSWNQVVSGWVSLNFPPPSGGGGCGIGPELALLVPLLARLRRRR